MTAVRIVKWIVIISAANSHQFAIGAVVTIFCKLKKGSNVTMVIQLLMMAALIIVKFFHIGSVITYKIRFLCVSMFLIAEMDSQLLIWGKTVMMPTMRIKTDAQIVKLILIIFVLMILELFQRLASLRFVIGAVEIIFISLKLENNVIMEIQQSMMAVQIIVRY
jgi:hypothetical protein